MLNKYGMHLAYRVHCDDGICKVTIQTSGLVVRMTQKQAMLLRAGQVWLISARGPFAYMAVYFFLHKMLLHLTLPPTTRKYMSVQKILGFIAAIPPFAILPHGERDVL